MREFLKGLPPRIEFAVVVVVAFGPLILASVAAALNPSPASPTTDAGLVSVVIYEGVQMALLAAFLAARGWTLEKIGLTPSLLGTGFGVTLFLASYFVFYVVWVLVSLAAPQTAQAAAATQVVAHGISPVTAIAVSVVNPIFEEVFVCGYVVAALKRDDNPWFAINVSVAIRLSYHLYQGPLGVISIIPLGLIYAYWFARTGKLWPVVVAHALSDLWALLLFT